MSHCNLQYGKHQHCFNIFAKGQRNHTGANGNSLYKNQLRPFLVITKKYLITKNGNIFTLTKSVSKAKALAKKFSLLSLFS